MDALIRRCKRCCSPCTKRYCSTECRREADQLHRVWLLCRWPTAPKHQRCARPLCRADAEHTLALKQRGGMIAVILLCASCADIAEKHAT